MKGFSMFYKSIFFLACMLFCLQGMASPGYSEGTYIKPINKKIQYVGRISFKNPNAPSFTYPGIQINARFEGTSLKMWLSR